MLQGPLQKISPASMRQLDFVGVRIIDATTAEKIINRIWTEDCSKCFAINAFYANNEGWNSLGEIK